MSRKARNNRAGLTAKLAVTAFCTAVGIFAVSEPGWSAILKAQGYYADLSLDLFLAQEGVSGTPTTLSAEVANHGPDSVDRYQVWFAGDVGIEIVDPDCSPSDGGTLCSIDAPLTVGEQAITPFEARLASSSEGILALGGFVQSDLFDLNRANDIDAKAIMVELVHGVGLNGDFPPDEPIGPDGRVRVRIENVGPGDAPRVQTFAYVNGYPADYQCVDEFRATCQSDGMVALQAGGHVIYSIAIPTEFYDLYGVVSIDVYAFSEVGQDTDPSWWWSVPLYATLLESGFE